MQKVSGLGRRRGYIVGNKVLPRASQNVCGFGKVLRSGYFVPVKGLKLGRYVEPRCIPARGLGRVLGPAAREGIVNYQMQHEGILRKHGYGQLRSTQKRRAAMMAALKEWPNPLGLLRHMNLILTRSRNRDTNRRGLVNMAADIQWLGCQHNYKGYCKSKAKRNIINHTQF